MADAPHSIGRYRILSVLGRGAMGTLSKAHDPEIDRLVAIKLIRTDLLAGADRAEFIARFRREAQAAGRCAHPNIVAIHDFALHDGDPFLVMEFIDGASLAQAWPAAGRFAVADAIFVMQQTLQALQAAHALGVVHRDIKPANIMLAGGRAVKVTDFGISRLETAQITQADSMSGTPSYMSPEQCRGETVDGRSDLFSAGVVLFEMLTGHKPFAGHNPAEVFTRLLHEPPPDPRGLVPDLPEDVAMVLARALAKAPADRFATAAEMATALSGAATTDHTIVLPVRTPPAGFDPALLDTLTRRLAETLGPIATYLVHSAVRKASSVDALCADLAARIDQPAARQRFEQDIRQQIARASTATGQHPAAPSATAVFPPAEVERLQQALAVHVGPLARLLVKRAMPGAPDLPALWQAVSAHIDDPSARAAFLRKASVP